MEYKKRWRRRDGVVAEAMRSNPDAERRRNKLQNFRYFEGVATLNLDDRSCIGCAVCTEVCPHGVLVLNGKKVQVADKDGCMECGACANNCPTGAVRVTPGVGCAAYIVQTWLKGKNMPLKTSCC